MTIEKMTAADGQSKNLLAENIEQLKRLFPEVITEGPNGPSIDFDHLRRLLGDQVEESEERFGLNWHGKARAKLIAQQPSTGTLRPMVEESVNWDSTQNLFIEGDNLEVLKLLQKSYHQKVKMIYIDPPYNTGKEFIYPDKFDDNLDTYLRYTGQKDDEGRAFGTNTETSGRYHTNWLNMIYPRLKLARNLLREDGCIFISIDDHEVDNLRLVCDEVFGEANFVATVIWQRVYAPKNSAKHLSEDHDYVLIYAKDGEIWRPRLLPRSTAANNRYQNLDDDPRGPWKPENFTARNFYSGGQYEVVGPTGKTFSAGRGLYWRVSLESFKKLDADNRVWWGANGKSSPAQKKFLSEVKDGITPQTLWKYEDVGHTQEAKKELLKYVNFQETENVLNSVKPVRLIRRMLQVATLADTGDLVLDFFAGSGPTLHGVLAQNAEDGGNRRCISVQLPEPLKVEEADFASIADLAKARARNVETELQEADPNYVRAGLRLLSLSSSNRVAWAGDSEDLIATAESLKPDRSELDIVFEILLKTGLDLSLTINEHNIAGHAVYEMGAGALMVCLAKTIDLELVEGIGALHDALAPEVCRVVFRDAGFADDATKTNAVQILKRHGIEDVKSL